MSDAVNRFEPWGPDRVVETLEAEIERLRAENAWLLEQLTSGLGYVCLGHLGQPTGQQPGQFDA